MAISESEMLVSTHVSTKQIISGENTELNHDEGYKLPGCWIATMKKMGVDQLKPH